MPGLDHQRILFVRQYTGVIDNHLAPEMGRAWGVSPTQSVSFNATQHCCLLELQSLARVSPAIDGLQREETQWKS
jgi:hypothetical protein